MTTTSEDWTARAAALADDIEKAGVPLSAEWRAAVGAVPRHVLVPEFYEQQGNQWRKVSRRQQLLEATYSLKTLVTHVTDGQPTSSSTTPTLMLRMLDWLDVHDGHDVLEIGTGTGYNAALLSARLGDAHVFSVDVEPELVELARQRLAETGYKPTLRAMNGADGMPDHAPFDRIIATCSVPHIPLTWFEQLRTYGLLLADLKLGMNAGNLVLLRRLPDRLEGRFVNRWGSFMSLRPEPAATLDPPAQQERSAGEVRERTTLIEGTPWFDDLVPWFMLHLDGTVQAGATFGVTMDSTLGRPDGTHLVDVDGSWCEVDLRVDGKPRRVRQGGDRNLWDAVENAYTAWAGLRHPGWERLGLTVTADHQTVWVDEPDGHRWPLPEPR
ncbi:methyltransferase domain-containing protein [Saccharopolyspora sp. WRP15-2]|uniref:Protein-L-isoaspartate O-methyltransferase n=1 Tax=Saccharopolyspora oryzae TaxID=2997343 RepID=A0ABT4UR93_9PSEU|nr:methyltransferase domain-containing protein [Saccharopolyspora oryzae]MDA3624238.1 methyltransferase domain-containing protein [Saccharopolyspora oryzae]